MNGVSGGGSNPALLGGGSGSGGGGSGAMSAAKRAQRQQQAAADGAFAARLALACLALAATMWVLLPSCEDHGGGGVRGGGGASGSGGGGGGEDAAAAAGPRFNATARVPRVVHHVLRAGHAAVPERFAAFVRSWRDHHPAWEHRLWRDNETRALVEERLPWFRGAFRALDRKRRTEMVRARVCVCWTLWGRGRGGEEIASLRGSACCVCCRVLGVS